MAEPPAFSATHTAPHLTPSFVAGESDPPSRMAGAGSEGAAAPSDGAAKKDLSNDDLKSYIRKQKAKIRKLEEQNKASAVDAGETEHTTTHARAWPALALLFGALLCSLRLGLSARVCTCAAFVDVFRRENERQDICSS